MFIKLGSFSIPLYEIRCLYVCGNSVRCEYGLKKPYETIDVFYYDFRSKITDEELDAKLTELTEKINAASSRSMRHGDSTKTVHFEDKKELPPADEVVPTATPAPTATPVSSTKAITAIENLNNLTNQAIHQMRVKDMTFEEIKAFDKRANPMLEEYNYLHFCIVKLGNPIQVAEKDLEVLRSHVAKILSLQY